MVAHRFGKPHFELCETAAPTGISRRSAAQKWMKFYFRPRITWRFMVLNALKVPELQIVRIAGVT